MGRPGNIFFHAKLRAEHGFFQHARPHASFARISAGETTKRAPAKTYGRICGLTVLFLAVFLFCPKQALAWGPGVHMLTCNWLLQNLGVLPQPVAAAIMEYPGLFLHGCLSADIFLGKGSVAKAGHSHNWSSGLALLHKSHTRQKRAYAYGYLSHLAADTVAHNVFVPAYLERAPGYGKMGHIYLEIQADIAVPWDKHDALAVFKEPGSRASERMLRNSMRQKLWNFWLKKHLFRRSIAIAGAKSWRASLHLLEGIFPPGERDIALQYLLTVSTRAMFSLLADTENSPVRGLDPIGAEALAQSGRGVPLREVSLCGVPTCELGLAAMRRHCPPGPTEDGKPEPSRAKKQDNKPSGAGSSFSLVLPKALADLPSLCGQAGCATNREKER